MAIRRSWIIFAFILTAAWAITLILPNQVGADTDIKVRICDPERIDDGEESEEGNTINRVLSAPRVSYGENRELGTIQIIGKEGIAIPLSEGQKIMLILPVGACYMQIPDESNYRNYVEWPELFEGKKNQIYDIAGEPGIGFVAATARSLTIELKHVDSSGDIMLINLLFNQDNYSKTRLASFVEIAEEYQEHGEEAISRQEFFTHMAQLLELFVASPLKPDNENIVAAEVLADIDEGQAEIDKILPLISGGFVKGYPGGLLLPEQSISRAEAAHLAGWIFGVEAPIPAAFSDDVPDWAEKGINRAYAAGVIRGYTDGNFRADRLLSKVEAITILQNCLESNLAPK